MIRKKRLGGGGAGIRTLGGVTPTTVFETAPFSRSGTPPGALFLPVLNYFFKRRTATAEIEPTRLDISIYKAHDKWGALLG